MFAKERRISGLGKEMIYQSAPSPNKSRNNREIIFHKKKNKKQTKKLKALNFQRGPEDFKSESIRLRKKLVSN